MNDNNIFCLREIKEKIEKQEIFLRLPDLQRDYVWGKVQWKRLWKDILQINDKIENDRNDEYPQHFMGILTLKETKLQDGKTVYDVLDGQQRLVTLLILMDYLDYDPKKFSSLDDIKSDIKSGYKDKLFNLDKNINNKKYWEIYQYFMELHYEIEYKYKAKLKDIVQNRLFFMLKFTDENENDVFESLNATGKNLEFADLILSYLIENNIDKSKDIKNKWNGLLKNIYGTYVSNASTDETDNGPDSDEDTIIEESETKINDTPEVENENEEIEASSPLKLKKFLNIMNSITLSERESISESIADFKLMTLRLGAKEFGCYCNKTDDPIDLIETLSKWEKLYRYIMEPQKNYGEKDELAARSYCKVLYYLSIWNITDYIPVIMRILYRNFYVLQNEKTYYSDETVECLLKAILSCVVHTRIIINRKHTVNNNIERKLKQADHIIDAYYSLSANKEKKIGEAVAEIFNELSEISIDIHDDAKVSSAIKNYQYNSSGSKFLLALYVDKESGTDSKVRLLEKENGKAQVEHMVAQNLEGGKFEDYDFDVGSIGLLNNLILLSGTTNGQIKNIKPEKKVDYWLKDEFGKLFFDDKNFDKKTIILNKNFRNSQEERVKEIVEQFKEYFEQYFEKKLEFPDKNKKVTLTFAKKQMKGILSGLLHSESSGDLKTGNAEYHYLRINKGKYEEHPPRDNNICVDYWVNGTKADKYDCFELIGSFIENIGKDKLGAWLEKCEEKIEKIDGGSNNVQLDKDNSFTYYQKMIHTSCLFNKLSPEQKKSLMGRTVQKDDANDEQKKQKEIEYENKKYICICNDFNISAVASTLNTLYSHFVDKNEFGLWIQVQRDIPYSFDGMMLHIPYINIGDTDKFNNWLKNNFQNILSVSINKENDLQPLPEKSEEKKCYFSYQKKQLSELEKLSFVIPEYQRRYVWDSNNRRELYRQIAGDKDLYLGTIVLRKEENEDSYRIVDGQQRLTTVAMIKKALGELEANSGLVRLSENRELNCVEKELKDIKADLKGFKCHFDVIYVSGPSIYQYDVFSSINSAGKKLTIEEKVKNYLMKRYSKESKKSKKSKKRIKDIAGLSGFAKALCECKKHEFCSSESIYNTFKDVTEKMEYDVLNFYYNVFSFIKCTTDSISDDNEELELPVWLKLIKALGVTTSDSLMLNWFTRIIRDKNRDHKAKKECINDLSKRICFIYFLLYVMDRPGDGKKSANSSFPKCMQVSDDTKENFASIILKSQADSQYWNTKNDISEQIWEQYIKTLPIYDLGYAHIKRFILLMLEYLMVNDTDTIKEWEENAAKQDTLDIEHIFPASDKNLPNDSNVRLSYSRLNYLDNLMLLESKINKTVKDKMLHDKLNDPVENNNTQENDQNKSKGYCDSKMFMAKMFRKSSRLDIPDRQNCIYDDKLADRRMELLKERIIKKLGEFLKDVSVPLKDVGSIPKEEKQESKTPLTSVSSARKKSSKKTSSTEKSDRKGMENVREVILRSMRIAKDKRKSAIDISDVKEIKKIRLEAMNELMKEKGHDKNYMNTISDNLTRRLGYKMEDFDRMLGMLMDPSSDCSKFFDKLRQSGMRTQDIDLIQQAVKDMKA